MTEFEEKLIKRLDLIENDLETLALATMMLPPPLIAATLAEGPERQAMLLLVTDLQHAHLRRSKALRDA